MKNRQNTTKIGLVLKCIRTAQKKSIKEVASAIELTPTNVKEIENGNKNPTYEILKLFATYFNYPTSKIVEIEELSKIQDLNYENVLSLCVELESTMNKNNNLESVLSK